MLPLPDADLVAVFRMLIIFLPLQVQSVNGKVELQLKNANKSVRINGVGNGSKTRNMFIQVLQCACVCVCLCVRVQQCWQCCAAKYGVAP